MDMNDPRLPKFFLLGIAVAGLLYVYFGTSWLPFTYPVQAKELASLRERYETLSLEINRARQSAKHLPHLEAEYEALQTKWSEANQLLPRENQIAGLLREVSFRGLTSGVEFVLFEPLPKVAGSFYTEHPIDVRVEGGYHQIAGFLNELAGMTRIVNVRGLEVEQTRPSDATKHVAKAHFHAVAYTLGVSPDAQPAENAGGGGNVVQSGRKIANKVKGRTTQPNAVAGGGTEE